MVGLILAYTMNNNAYRAVLPTPRLEGTSVSFLPLALIVVSAVFDIRLPATHTKLSFRRPT